ncbi:putative quinol monooxygenase [Phaeobacter inhibens]|uniref:putative quinol monooxygenase n=1 Tax=Phaeobacter inhibens TaxID=221822 RepID=UPI00076BB4FF|nr:putative quinol monooxygenase [Phaeobacter inhibens]KXF90576.1 antibiotic biosynthesis monooxygenase [Phaeobacter inhibens]WHP69634.1 putative quinol monooxygenase [Phaeobacter inhibens]
MTTQFQLIAKISPKPEHMQDVRDSLTSILAPTRAEPGCLKFNLLEGRSGDCFYLDEEWISDDALAAHYEMDYIKPIFAKYENWLAAPAEIHKMTALA